MICAAEKLEQAENQLAHTRFGSMLTPSQRKKEVSFWFDIGKYSICQ